MSPTFVGVKTCHCGSTDPMPLWGEMSPTFVGVKTQRAYRLRICTTHGEMSPTFVGVKTISRRAANTIPRTGK